MADLDRHVLLLRREGDIQMVFLRNLLQQGHCLFRPGGVIEALRHFFTGLAQRGILVFQQIQPGIQLFQIQLQLAVFRCLGKNGGVDLIDGGVAGTQAAHGIQQRSGILGFADILQQRLPLPPILSQSALT